MSDKEQKQSPIRVHVLSGYRPIEVFCIAYNGMVLCARFNGRKTRVI